MSDSVHNIREMFEEVKEGVREDITSLTDSVRDSLIKPFRRVLLGRQEQAQGQGQERPLQGQTCDFDDKQYSFLPDEKENHNPNQLFAPPTPPRVNKEGVKPSTPVRFHTPAR